jgi:murein peptide amidase A
MAKLKFFTILFFVLPGLMGYSEVATAIAEKTPAEICKSLEGIFTRLRWAKTDCHHDKWKTGGTSVQGRPLIYQDFGDPKATNRTLVLSMVHPDELNPLYLGMKLIIWLEENINKIPNSYVVVAPIVNPDGLFRYPKPAIRMNANDVDINRNFPTQDWATSAHSNWTKIDNKSKRKFPGKTAGSEPETVFQQFLIEHTKPTKIISLHAPLNYLDYDGPDRLSLAKLSEDYVKRCLELRNHVKAKSTGYFPGSLGNYAGNEKGIPTFTLELPTAYPGYGEKYWQDFQAGIKKVIEFSVIAEPKNG